MKESTSIYIEISAQPSQIWTNADLLMQIANAVI